MAEAMTKEKETAQRTQEAVKRGVQRATEMEPTQAVTEFSEKLPTTAFAIAAGASILASAILFGRKQRDWAIFVGEWAPTFLITGLFYKLLMPSKEK